MEDGETAESPHDNYIPDQSAQDRGAPGIRGGSVRRDGTGPVLIELEEFFDEVAS
jgi:hypothetical protein